MGPEACVLSADSQSGQEFAAGTTSHSLTEMLQRTLGRRLRRRTEREKAEKIKMLEIRDKRRLCSSSEGKVQVRLKTTELGQSSSSHQGTFKTHYDP